MDENQIINGELVNDSPQSPATTTEVSSGQIVINLEGLIKTNVAAADQLQAEIRKYKEMLDDILANDKTFQQHSEKAKEAAKLKQGTKAQILQQPQAKELDDKVKTLKSELKENQVSLSDYLQEYQRLSGVNEIEGEDGQVREIIYTAKLIRKSAKFQ